VKHIFLFLLLAVVVFGQDNPPMPPHVSAITPPPIPMEQPFLRRVPRNVKLLYLPEGKTADELLSVGSMQMEDLLERVRTNRYNLYLLELRDAGPPPLRPALISPEDELVLSNHHRAMPQHP
jgi:hypothetical protein